MKIASAATKAGEAAPFLIPATNSLQERQQRTLKQGDTFALFDHNGDSVAGPGNPEGIYHRDTRYLSHLYLTIEGVRPILLSSTLRDDNATLTCDLTNPDLYDSRGHILIEHDLIHIRRSRFLWDATCYERLAIRNFDTAPRTIRLQLTFAADFADLFEVRGTKRARRGVMERPQAGRDWIRLRYTGLDDTARSTQIRFEPVPTHLTPDQASFDVDLAPRQTRSIFIEIKCNGSDDRAPVGRRFFTCLRDSRRALRASASRAAAIATSNELFNEAIRRSVSDLYMLITDLPQGPYPYAGIPWFSTIFGRDAIITALQTLWIDPNIARGVLLYLAAHQAQSVDAAADAEPGKILHEVRHGEMAQLREVPFGKYYGSIDSTPLFVMLAGEYLRRTNDLETVRRIWPNIEAALRWIDEFGDRDGDGFVEYSRQTPDGLVNQGWKDSQDSISHADGTLARGPIALVEVQAYVFGALIAASQIAAALDEPGRSAALSQSAQLLQKQFDKAFFDEELGTYVLALDGDKKPCRVSTSNAGHALFTGIALRERAASVTHTLLRADSFSGWGIRTLSATEKRFNPMSYHNGSVWPHDNSLAAAGFARYGFRREAARIFQGLYDASTYIDLRRLPELFCGFARQTRQGPTFYPVACSPQAWAAAAPILLLQSCIGISFNPANRTICFENPVLPPFLDQVQLLGLSVNGTTADINLQRSGNQVVVEVSRRHGPVRVVTNY